MLYIIGLGLADERDISTKGLEIVKRAERVYLEAYTAVLLVEKEQLEAYYGRSVIIADREMVESQSDDILAGAHEKDVAFLVVGDPFSATTHTDLALRCRQHEPHIATRTLPNASILTAVGATGLSLYNYGQTVSMVFFTETWKPDSFYDRVAENASLGLHTLVLLDIKVKEPNLQALARGKIVYEPPRFMTVAQCASQMIEVEETRQQGITAKEKLAIGVARLGSEGEQIVAGTLEELTQFDLGKPLHSLVLVGTKMHEMEWEFAREFAVDKEKFDEIWKRDYVGKN
ncbi:Diphthine methyl ester synthase [Fulvia fulva]|uniref:Diphthine methyl ester synthase n=1 Tax=Passalora fulva TaxID=5499 RepID=A0A9Q8PG68_PASFU|nr:Diphthine methyl ester synthase [Fulvia fulva]KAK4613398.1 Diphthine methyl ester synthase [Fulvia fulva]KAK4615028.1 Diphthine methyl ester synthase [Fulvia fulva]UJO21841.1 Diphthine methyl ester synthase [Fulvia fulva]WPV20227.1 Diphthine methyl ester synthase [Fulvia fulva]WPV35713.1 Diphthine methyl ester synthase [Fulvia fulva]